MTFLQNCNVNWFIPNRSTHFPCFCYQNHAKIINPRYGQNSVTSGPATDARLFCKKLISYLTRKQQENPTTP